MIIVTACSSGWYPRLVGLIGSLHVNNYDLVEEIRVHDIGLTEKEHDYIAGMQKVVMCETPLVNPQTLTPLKAREYGDPYMYVGLMTWKPAILKKTLEVHPQAFWFDSGVTVWGRLDKLWNHLTQTGYFFVECDVVNTSTTETNRRRLNVEQEILDSTAINAGMFGFSRMISEKVVDPLYEWAKDISLFVDDGTAPGGKTAARHEQTLLSILVARAGLHRFAQEDIKLCDGTVIRIVHSKERLNADTVLYHSRGDTRFNQERYIQFKK